MSWEIRVPHRSRDEPVDAKSIWELPNALDDPDERAVAREYLVVIRTCGGRTVGQALDVIKGCDTANRRLFLDGCRKLAGLPLTKEVDDRTAYELANKASQARGNPMLQYCAHCDRVPLTATGSLAETRARKWHCPEHAHLAQPGDLEDRPAPWRYSDAGTIIEVDESEAVREAERARSRRRQREAQAPDRAVEVEERRRRQEPIAEEHRRLTPPRGLGLTPHRQLIAHELGHALVGLLAGARVEKVWAPPPPDFDGVPPDNPDEPAGFVLSRGGDRRAKAISLLGGPLAEGKPAPAWPIRPRTDDERQLAEIVNEQDELSYLEIVRDAEQILGSDEFNRMNTFASELLVDPPHQLNERQLEDIMQLKNHTDEDSEGLDEALELERRLIAEGIIPARAERYQQADPVLTGLGSNGDHASEEKAYEKAHPVRAEARAAMLALFDAADKQAPKPERKTAAPIQIASFEC